MTFPAEEGWKVPRYLGSCGRLGVVEYTGERLTQFSNADFATRARLGAQLLKIVFDIELLIFLCWGLNILKISLKAFNFTQNSHGLAVYLTDWSTDNFAVDQKSVLTVIDLEHVVIVDQSQV